MDADVIIIGAGVIGLSLAARFSGKGYSVILLEKDKHYGSGISSRHSEVIHAGVYYHTGSLKASLCVRGRDLLYDYCRGNSILHNRIGKIFLAVEEEDTAKLELTYKQAKTNGVDDLVWWDRGDIKKHEPAVKGAAGLLSPSSGVINSHDFMDSLFSLGQSNGVMFASDSPVTGATYSSSGWEVHVGGRDPVDIKGKSVINAAGLYAIELSRKVFPGRDVPRFFPTKGSYVRFSGKSPVKHIIYPDVKPGSIIERVDATPDIQGSLRFGPTVEEFTGLDDFNIPEGLIKRITPGILRYLPGIELSKVHLDSSGIRPKLYNAGDPVKDFRFDWAPQAGWLDLWGIESPGFTASLGIAEHVFNLFKEKDIL